MSALVQKPRAAMEGPMVMIGMQVMQNKRFQITRAGRPSVMISPSLVGFFSFEEPEIGLFFFSFKVGTSLSLVSLLDIIKKL